MTSKKSVSVDIEAYLNPGFSGAFRSADDKMSELRGTIGTLERQARQMNSFDKMKKSAEEGALAIRGFENELQALQSELVAQEKAGKKATREQKKQQRELQKNIGLTTREYDKNRNKLNKLREELGQAGIDTNRLSDEQDKLASSLHKSGSAYQRLAKNQKLSKASGRYRDRRSQAASDTMGAFAPVLAAGAAIANPMRFGHEMARVYSLTGADKDQKQDLENVAKFVAENYATTSMKAAEAEGIFGQAGFNPAEIAGMLPSNFDVVEATRAESDQVANLIGNIKTAFNLDATAQKNPDGSVGKSDDMSFLANLITKTSNTSKASVESLTESSKYLLDKPQGFGMSPDETFAYLATVGDFGLLDSMAGTSFGQLMERLAKKDTQDKLVKAGINPYKTDEKTGQKVLQKPHEIALQWSERFQGVDKNNAELQALQTDIFQTQAWQFMGPLVEGVRSGKLDTHLKGLSREKLGADGSEKNYAQKKREEMQDTAWGQSIQVLSKLDKASLETFGSFEENIKDTAKSLQGLIRSYTEFVENKENKELVKSLLKATGAMIGFNVAIKASRFLFRATTGGIFDLYNGYSKLRTGIDSLRKSEKLALFWTNAHGRAKKIWTFLTGMANRKAIASAVINAKSAVSSKASMIWDYGSAKAKAFLAFVTGKASKAASLFRLQTWKNIAVTGLSKAASIASATATGVATAAQWAWNVALKSNPIGAVVTAVGGLVAGGIWLYNNWRRLPEIFTGAWKSLKQFVMFWKDDDLSEKKPGVDTSELDEYQKAVEGEGMEMPMQPHLTESITIPDQKIIDIIFNYPDPLKVPETLTVSGPAAIPDNVVSVDFTEKVRKEKQPSFDTIPDLRYQKYQEIPGDSGKISSASDKSERLVQDQRKIIIQKLVISPGGNVDEKKLSNMIADQLRDVVDQNWGESLYDSAEAG